MLSPRIAVIQRCSAAFAVVCCRAAVTMSGVVTLCSVTNPLPSVFLRASRSSIRVLWTEALISAGSTAVTANTV